MIREVCQIGQVTAFVATLYIAGAALCRLRHAYILRAWAALYTAVFGVASWCGWSLTQGPMEPREMLIVLMAAAYVHMTRHSWIDGVPDVARRVG